MKLLKKITLIGFLLLVVFYLSSCKKDIEDIEYYKIVDGFEEVNIAYFTYPELENFTYFKHLIIDSNIYVINNEGEIAKFDMDGSLLFLKSYYSLEHQLIVRSWLYTKDNHFFITGYISTNQGDWTLYNPILIKINKNGDLVLLNVFSWENHGRFYLITNTFEDNYIIYGYKRKQAGVIRFLMEVNSHGDSLNSIILKNHRVIPRTILQYTDTSFLLIGEYDDDNNHKNNGVVTEYTINGNVNYYYKFPQPEGPHGIYVNRSSVYDIYLLQLLINSYNFSRGIDFYHYNLSGDLIRMMNIPIECRYDYNAEMNFVKFDKSFLLTGNIRQFYTPSPPVFYGSFIIKFDDIDNEIFRLFIDDEYGCWIENMVYIDTNKYLIFANSTNGYDFFQMYLGFLIPE